MAEYNPYAPPGSDLSEAPWADPGGMELADRGTRLGAAFLDGLILGVPVVVLLWLLYSAFGHQFWVPVPGMRGILLSLGAVAVGAAVDLAVNGALLVKHGQTVGKRICKIKIIKTTGEVPTLVDSYLKRRLLFSLAQQVPIAGGIFSLVDALLIFRESHRTLHDQVAGTLVVKA
jgi:uncharacterized RDD family membrane protein YckC